jgi:hypothetical protein
MIGASGFRETIRTATVSHPIPFILAVLLAFALACFGGAAAATGVVSWIMAAAALFSMLSGIAITCYAVAFKESLLRSERHSLVMRYIEAVGDSDDPATRTVLSETLPTLIETKTSKRSASYDSPAEDGEGNDD